MNMYIHNASLIRQNVLVLAKGFFINTWHEFFPIKKTK